MCLVDLLLVSPPRIFYREKKGSNLGSVMTVWVRKKSALASSSYYSMYFYSQPLVMLLCSTVPNTYYNMDAKISALFSCIFCHTHTPPHTQNHTNWNTHHLNVCVSKAVFISRLHGGKQWTCQTHSHRETESSLYFKHSHSVSQSQTGSLGRIIKNSFLKYLPFLRNILFLKCVKDRSFSSPLMLSNSGVERRN